MPAGAGGLDGAGVVEDGGHHVEERDLLLDAGAAVLEAHAQRFILDFVPAGADAETKAPVAQHVEAGRLLCDQHGLALRQYQNAGHEADLRRGPGHEREQHEGIVELRFEPVRAVPAGTRCGVRTDDMVISEDVGKTHGFDRLRKVLHSAGANKTNSEARYGLHMSYLYGWLTPEEAGCLGVTEERAKTFTKQQQQLLGYRCYDASELNGGRLWTVDYEDVPTGLGWAQ